MDLTWLGPCWPGIECGDAGGWLSGLATLVAVIWGSHQARRAQQSSARAASLLVMPHLFGIAKRCRSIAGASSSELMRRRRYPRQLFLFCELGPLQALQTEFRSLPLHADDQLLLVLQEVEKLNADVQMLDRINMQIDDAHSNDAARTWDTDAAVDLTHRIRASAFSTFQLCELSLTKLFTAAGVGSKKKQQELAALSAAMLESAEDQVFE